MRDGVRSIQAQAATRAFLVKSACLLANLGILALPIYLLGSWAEFGGIRLDGRLVRFALAVELGLAALGLAAFAAERAVMGLRIAAAFDSRGAAAPESPGAGALDGPGLEGGLCFARLMREVEGWSFGAGGLLGRDAGGLFFARRGSIRRFGPDCRIAVSERGGAYAAFVLKRRRIRRYLRVEGAEGTAELDVLAPEELLPLLGGADG